MSGHSPSTTPVLDVRGADPRLYNEDLAPVAPAGRHWGYFDIFAMWMSDVHSVGGYTFAASLFFLGLTGWQVLVSMAVGITAVYFLMNLIGTPSQKYGVPYPVVARMSFGVMGANLAAIVRGVVVESGDVFKLLASFVNFGIAIALSSSSLFSASAFRSDAKR